jgi:hypothetical protein
MHNETGARVGRRGFLALGILAASAGVWGCDDPSTPTQIDTPPAKGGNRGRLAERKPEMRTTKANSETK